MTSIIVPSSGDWSGVQDTLAIRQAQTSLLKPASHRHTGHVILDGEFYINEPLVFGAADSCPVVLGSTGTTQLRYVGPPTDGFALTFTAAREPYSRAPVLANVLLNCDQRCRGVHFDYLPHHLLMQNVMVLWWRQLGAEVTRCWGASLRDSSIRGGVGIAARTSDFNNATISNLQIQGSAGQQPGEWPDGPVEERAGLVLKGRGIAAQSLTFEGSKWREYPNLFLSTCRSHIDGIWQESTSNRFAKVVAHSDGVPPGTLHSLTISRVDGTCGGQPGSCRAFLELRGISSNVELADSYLTQLGEAVVYASSGRHTNVRVSRCTTAHVAIPQERVLTATPGSIITTGDTPPPMSAGIEREG